MIGSEEETGVLSRDELAALLEGLGGGEQSAKDWSSGSRGRFVVAALQRAHESFAVEESRFLSNTYQTVIDFTLIGNREIEYEELVGMMLPTDRIAVFALQPTGARGCLLISRPMMFNVMCLNFGARPGLKRFPTPERNYTRIELRFLQGLYELTLGHLSRAWSQLLPVEADFISLQGAEWIEEYAHDKVILASFDVHGFGEVCRVRVAVPAEPFAGLEALARESDASSQSAMEDMVLELPVSLSVEASASDVPLTELRDLRVGEVIEFPPTEDGKLTVRVEGRPKFKGVRGTVGSRVAVQLTDLIE